MKRKHKHEEHVDEGWLLPYADMLTLLLALFIVMFAMAKVDDTRLDALSDQFNIILSGEHSGGNGGILPAHPKQQSASPTSSQTDEDKMVSAGDAIKEDLTEAGHANDVDIALEKDGLRIAIKSGLLFSSGSAEIPADIESLVSKISDSLKTLDNDLIIAGYTDNVPNQTEKYASNWELSAARAIKVMDFLVKNNAVKEDQISIQAYGEFNPKVPNNNAENRAKNRRVEIFVVRKDQSRSN
ncbi:OmpA family protein [Vagococcus sp. BWB3-3]|uniref:OmpA family protein n=1 Tax=Vagococcus allomyrinae TaxID=2794353 RepID=A0A940PBR1_9ENTE|nr:OmpA family protein [Vagococcus allomyrinae]MBP1042054.1 OmpA family protein [Vagococcus allomyrinae]